MNSSAIVIVGISLICIIKVGLTDFQSPSVFIKYSSSKSTTYIPPIITQFSLLAYEFGMWQIMQWSKREPCRSKDANKCNFSLHVNT